MITSQHPRPIEIRSAVRRLVGNPWGRPRFLAAITWAYVIWALVPVIVAVTFSFNAGRSRSVWQGFSLRWWTRDPSQSILHDPDYLNALHHGLVLAGLDMAIATPLGVLLGLGIARWRGPGSAPANFLLLVPLVTPELILAVALFLVLTRLTILPFSLVHLGTAGQLVGQVTLSVSFVVVIVRSRLNAIGPEYEEAAQDLGATPSAVLRLILLPLLLPAIIASTLLVFALSIDDFVVTQYMSSNSASTTVPMLIYADARGAATTPALNAIATVLLVITLTAVAVAYLLYRVLGRRSARSATIGAPDDSITTATEKSPITIGSQ